MGVVLRLLAVCAMAVFIVAYLMFMGWQLSVQSSRCSADGGTWDVKLAQCTYR